MKKIIFLLLYWPFFISAQSYIIDENNLQMFGNTDNSNISVNTYYNTLDTCVILWNIINDSLPPKWEFSICFDDCYSIGVTSGQDVFIPNEQIYLGCHIYPNGQEGFGIVQMEIITNDLYKDTVTWSGYIDNISSLADKNSKNIQPIKILDFLGRNSKEKNQPLFYIYDDGTVEKKIVLQ